MDKNFKSLPHFPCYFMFLYKYPRIFSAKYTNACKMEMMEQLLTYFCYLDKIHFCIILFFFFHHRISQTANDISGIFTWTDWCCLSKYSLQGKSLFCPLIINRKTSLKPVMNKYHDRQSRDYEYLSSHPNPYSASLIAALSPVLLLCQNVCCKLFALPDSKKTKITFSLFLLPEEPWWNLTSGCTNVQAIQIVLCWPPCDTHHWVNLKFLIKKQATLNAVRAPTGTACRFSSVLLAFSHFHTSCQKEMPPRLLITWLPHSFQS